MSTGIHVPDVGVLPPVGGKVRVHEFSVTHHVAREGVSHAKTQGRRQGQANGYRQEPRSTDLITGTSDAKQKCPSVDTTGDPRESKRAQFTIVNRDGQMHIPAIGHCRAIKLQRLHKDHRGRLGQLQQAPQQVLHIARMLRREVLVVDAQLDENEGRVVRDV